MADMGWGVVRDGHGENVRESLKQVHYDYKNRLGGMMRKFSWMLLVLLAFWAGCQDQTKVQEPSTVEQKSEPVAAQLSEEEVVVGSAEELKTVSPKNITWKKDGAKNESSYVLMADDRCPDGVWATAALETLRIGSTEFLKAIESKDVEAAKSDFSQIEKILCSLP